MVSISLSSGFSFQGLRRSYRLNGASAAFQSRYRAASHFRLNLLVRADIRNRFQSRYRAASHFRVAKAPVRIRRTKFQSRYRAASHFRGSGRRGWKPRLRVSISLSSGFSFQAIHIDIFSVCIPFVSISLSSGFSFQVNSRIEGRSLHLSFNLVIERLLISGRRKADARDAFRLKFQSRYRAASHFRHRISTGRVSTVMFQSRYRAASHFR